MSFTLRMLDETQENTIFTILYTMYILYMTICTSVVPPPNLELSNVTRVFEYLLMFTTINNYS